VLELLGEYFEISRDDDERKRGERILGKVLRLDRNLEDTLPYLYSLQGIVGNSDSLAQMDPQVRRRRTLDAIKRIFVRESLNQPLMIIFEDLHWIDTETQALLNLMVNAIANARILLLVNFAPNIGKSGAATLITRSSDSTPWVERVPKRCSPRFSAMRRT
jgi:predicted ATPase